MLTGHVTGSVGDEISSLVHRFFLSSVEEAMVATALAHIIPIVTRARPVLACILIVFYQMFRNALALAHQIDVDVEGQLFLASTCLMAVACFGCVSVIMEANERASVA